MPQVPDERWSRVEESFHRASECPLEDRPALLDGLCAGDGELRNEVESLLEAAAAEARAAGGQASEADPWIGRTVGPYRLDRLLGRGGMGAVYFGRRVEGEFEQEIAFKLAAGRFTNPWLRERFLRERQTLASLSHPNIARLLDGGITAEGEPYLVMEYIDGLPLDRYCDETKTSVPEILQVMLQLADAVSFIHRHLVVHRDLKPGNVLVTREGVVKLLDFGAAKLLYPEHRFQSEATRLGMRVFTPQYASPEQVLGERITTASDVYSLGVILYRLLTGQLPFDAEGASSPLARELAETVPVAPHAAVTAPAGHGKRASELRADAVERRAAIRGDLDAIVLKALSTDPKDRYASVDELAADLRNHLEHRPVAARAGRPWYRVRKFIRRHSLGVAAILTIAAAAVAGSAVTIRQGRLAAKQEQRARAGIREIQGLANLLLFDFYDQVKQLPGSTGVQRRLAAQAVRYLDAISHNDDPAIQMDLVEAYTKMGNVLGNPYEENLGDAPQAISTLGKALRLCEGIMKTRAGDPGVIRKLDLARRSLAEVHFSIGDTDRAVEYSRAAAQSFDELAARPDAVLADVQEAASTWDSLGDLFGLHGSASTGDLNAALDSYRRSRALHERALVINPGNVRSQRGIAIVEMKIANARSDNEPTIAAQGYADALAALDRLPPEARRSMPTPRIAAVIRHKLGSLNASISRPRQAVPFLVSARDLFASLAARDPDDSRTRVDLSTVYYDLGQVRERLADRIGAREDYRRVVHIFDDLLRRDRLNLVWQGHRAEAMYRAGCLDRALGTPDDGSRTVREALDLSLWIADHADASAADLDRAAGYLLDVDPAGWRNPERALRYATAAVARSREANASFLLTLIKAQQASGRMREARQAAAKAMALLPPPAPGQPASELRRKVQSAWQALEPR